MRKLCYTIIGFTLYASLLAQETGKALAPGQYFFHKGDVVFEFDKRIYATVALAADTSADLDFSDLNLLEAAEKGDFSAWTKEGWKLKRLDRNRYQLCKPLEKFDDKLSWDLKFILEQGAPSQRGKKSQGVLGKFEIPVASQTIQENPKGNSLFRLSGFTTSHKVILSGNFNGWDEHNLKMKPAGDGWELRLDLKPGHYEYKFIVDGQWMEDPANPEKVINEHGTFNSVLRVYKTVKFTLKGFQESSSIMLAGNFNNWHTSSHPMTKTSTGWETEVPLVGGKHEYKYIIDGAWTLDPANPRTETTWDGYINSLLIVK